MNLAETISKGQTKGKSKYAGGKKEGDRKCTGMNPEISDIGAVTRKSNKRGWKRKRRRRRENQKFSRPNGNDQPNIELGNKGT